MQESHTNKRPNDFDDEIDLRELFYVLFEGKWIINSVETEQRRSELSGKKKINYTCFRKVTLRVLRLTCSILHCRSTRK